MGFYLCAYLFSHVSCSIIFLLLRMLCLRAPPSLFPSFLSLFLPSLLPPHPPLSLLSFLPSLLSNKYSLSSLCVRLWAKCWGPGGEQDGHSPTSTDFIASQGIQILNDTGI